MDLHVEVLQQRVEPAALGGATASVSNGLVTNESRLRKKIPMPISTAITTGISSRLRFRLVRTTIAVKPVKIHAHSSREPAWLPHRAVIL